MNNGRMIFLKSISFSVNKEKEFWDSPNIIFRNQIILWGSNSIYFIWISHSINKDFWVSLVLLILQKMLFQMQSSNVKLLVF